MRTNYIPIDDVDQTETLKDPDGAPISRFATTWLLGDLGFFRVYLLVVGPKSEEPKSNLSLCRSKAEDILKAISDVVILFNKKAR